MKHLPAAGSIPEGQGLEGTLSGGEVAGGRCFSSPPSSSWLGASRSQLEMLHLPCSQFSALSELPSAPTLFNPLSPAVVFVVRQVEGISFFFSFPSTHSLPIDWALVGTWEPSLKLYISLLAAEPCGGAHFHCSLSGMLGPAAVFQY